MAETSSPPPLSGVGDDGGLRQKICEKIKTHRGTPEALTKDIAKIILREGLGLADKQITEEYQCYGGLISSRRGSADLAVTYEDVNLEITKRNPKIILELKRRERRFILNDANYFKDVKQLKSYMNSKPCQTVEHGIIFNVDQLQVFRKHGGLIFSITKIIDFPDFDDQSSQAVKSIEEVIAYLKDEIIEKPRTSQRLPGTTITVWNNKGGVGKTTVVSYLSLLLSIKDCPRKTTRKNKVLVIDFDHNQANLTKRLGHEKSGGDTDKLLNHIRKHRNLDEFELKRYFKEIKCKKQKTVIYLLPADGKLSGMDTEEYENRFYEDNILRGLCLELVKRYDYVIIDTPPGWEQSIYSRAAVAAADCLLPISSYGDFDSFHNYYHAVLNKLPEIYQERPDQGPDNLGLWINNWQSSDGRRIHKMNSEELESYIKKAPKERREEVRQSFFDNNNNTRKIKYSAWAIMGACHNPKLKVHLLDTFNHSDTRKAYSDLLGSIIGEVR